MSVTLIQNTKKDLVPSTRRSSKNDQPNIVFLDKLAKAPRSKTSAGCRKTEILHVVAHAEARITSAAFYKEVFGMKILCGSAPGQPFCATAFPTSYPDEEHREFAPFPNPIPAHASFKVSSLDDLRAVYERAIKEGIPIRLAVDHGCSYAIYIGGPDGNVIEVYWPTGDVSISGRPCPAKARRK